MVTVTLMSSQFWDKLANRLASILLAVLVIYVGKLLASVTWFAQGYMVDEKVSLIADDPNRLAKNRGATMALPLDLFGRMEVKPVAPSVQVQPADAPKTMLRLELNGVFLAAEPRQSAAIIAERGQDSEYYRVGDTLPGGVVLESVYPNHVILNRAGKFEKLVFDETKDPGSSIQPTQRTTTEAVAPMQPEQIHTPEQFVEEATRRLGENPIGALASVGLRPAANGQAAGYVFDGNNPMLTRLNLKPGDVIRSVNGNRLGALERDKELLQELSSQSSLEVEVERNGTSFFINYPLHQ